MAKSKIKFNVSDIFMEGQNTVTDRNLFVSSPLFGIFAALYNRSGGTVKVGKIETDSYYPASGKILFIKRVFVVNKWGLQVCNIFNSSVDYNSIVFNVSHTPINHDNYASAVIQTSNPKYLQSKVSSSSLHDAASRFSHALKKADLFFNDMVCETVAKAVRERFGTSIADREGLAIRANLTDSATTFLAKFFAGDAQSSQLSPQDRTVFDLAYRRYREAVEKFKVAMKDTYDMVSTEKFIYVTNVNGGVILGAIRPEPMCAALDTLAEGQLNVPNEYSFNYIQETLPIKWYPSYESIPEDIRQQLEFSMVMLKTHVGARAAILEDAGDYVFHELGSRYYAPGHGDSQFYFLTK